MRKLCLPLLAVLLLGDAALPQQPTTIPQLGIKLSVDQLNAQIHVTAGRRLRPPSCPDGARVAVAVGFDVDEMTASLARGDLTPGVLSRGEYGAIDGLLRILRLLDKHELSASFFIPAVSDALHPQMLRSIVAKAIGKRPDDAYEMLLDGSPTGVIELPIEWILDDYPVLNLPGGVLTSPELVSRMFQSEFDVAYDEGGLFILTMYSHVTGHRSRIPALEKLILHMKSRPGVWFGTHEQVARYVKDKGGR